MLGLRPNCELCDKDLPPHSPDARICTYECTFCAHCVNEVLHNVCPNCGGNFCVRPLRPNGAHRDGVGLQHHPASTARKHTPYSTEQLKEFAAKLRDVDPSRR